MRLVASLSGLWKAMFEDAIVRWTARLFVACYVARVGIDASGRRDAAAQGTARWLWTIGCAFLLVHIAAAFHLVHGWSHTAAYEHVLARTHELTGWASGIGLYVNYGFTLVWVADTILWWRNLEWVERPRPYWLVQGMFAFLMVQATVVFGPPFWWPVAAVVVVMLIALRRKLRGRSSPSEGQN
jgi:hypothetical protein